VRHACDKRKDAECGWTAARGMGRHSCRTLHSFLPLTPPTRRWMSRVLVCKLTSASNSASMRANEDAYVRSGAVRTWEGKISALATRMSPDLVPRLQVTHFLFSTRLHI